MPEILGRYELERRIAAGGMGEVLLARQSGPGGFSRKCVIKRLHADASQDPNFVKMFLVEARINAHLSHPNIAQLYDFGEADGCYYLAMEYVPGASLYLLNRAFRATRRFLPTAAILRILADAARALHYAHHANDEHGKPLGLVHRDVSPGNVLVSTAGVVKLIDFGIAKITATSGVTQNGVVKGKLQYMSPEQINGERLDARSDVYQLGLVAYELLTGTRAFGAGGMVEVMAAVTRNQFPPLEGARPGLPAPVYAIVNRALAARPENRFQSAAELAKALDAELLSAEPKVTPAQVAALVADALQWKEEQERKAGVETGPGRSPVAATREEGAHQPSVPLGDDQLPTDERPAFNANTPTVEMQVLELSRPGHGVTTVQSAPGVPNGTATVQMSTVPEGFHRVGSAGRTTEASGAAAARRGVEPEDPSTEEGLAIEKPLPIQRTPVQTVGTPSAITQPNAPYRDPPHPDFATLATEGMRVLSAEEISLTGPRGAPAPERKPSRLPLILVAVFLLIGVAALALMIRRLNPAPVAPVEIAAPP